MKISVCELGPQTACSYYRSIGPLTKLRHLDKNIEVNMLNTVTWNNLLDTDILFLARPFTPNFLEMFKMAKDLNIPVWVDWDDNILEIPDHNPASDIFKDRKAVEIIEYCLTNADIVTVSTQEIKDYFSPAYNENIVVIENAFNDYDYRFEIIKDQFASILWRGSKTHRQDLMSVRKEMQAVARQNEKWTFVFCGGSRRDDNLPWYIYEEIKNKFVIQEELDIVTYNKFVKDNRSVIMQVPLLVNNFNKCKSNIAWIEGTWAGSAVIAPDLPEFNKPGVINYSDPEKYQYYLEKLIKSNDFRRKNYLESFEYIKDNLMLSDVNKKRQSIIEEIL